MLKPGNAGASLAPLRLGAVPVNRGAVAFSSSLVHNPVVCCLGYSDLWPQAWEGGMDGRQGLFSRCPAELAEQSYAEEV